MSTGTKHTGDGPASSSQQHRTGLVLGAGGLLGGCWSLGALRALEDHTGPIAQQADVIVGTSAGALLSALLSCDISTGDVVANERGFLTEGPMVGYDCATSLTLRPPRWRLAEGATKLFAQCLTHPLSAPLMNWYAALAPQGQGSLQHIRELIDHATCAPEHSPEVRIVATHYGSCQRTVFRPAHQQEPRMADAVTASCSVPGLFPPVPLNGKHYVDGAVGSPTNADLLLHEDVDTAYVVAPMAANTLDRSWSPMTQLERLLRRLVNRTLRAEVRTLRQAGVTTTVLAPTAVDLETIGVNAMNSARRVSVLDTAIDTTTEQLQTMPNRTDPLNAEHETFPTST